MQKKTFTYLLSKFYLLNERLEEVKKRLVISPFILLLVSCVFIVLMANTVFFDKLDALYPWQGNLSFIISLSLLLFSLIIFVMFVLNILLPVKIVVLVMLLIAAMVDYYGVVLGVLIDKTMIQNIVETNFAEAQEIVNLGLFSRIIFMAILPAALLLLIQVKRTTWQQRLRQQVLSITAIMMLIPILIAPFSAQYTSFFRLHKELRYYTNPLYPIYSALDYLAEQIVSVNTKEFRTLTTKISKSSSTLKPKLMILVVGEAVRADHLTLNGYPRDTTPNMSKQVGLINFSQVSSCGTSTAVSVPCMFSFFGRDDFTVSEAKSTQNILDVLAASSVRVSWRDNNSSSKGVADRLAYQSYRRSEVNTLCDVECRDVGMLVNLQQYIDQQTQDTLIVLHQMGNHGPAYFKRYPADFEFFTPACESAELSECSKHEIVNAYDNAIRYTDHFLAEVIKLLQANAAQYNTVMLYVSDHGESLGENGLYLHGMPYAFAPDAQTHVPIISWSSAPYIDIEKTKLHQDHAHSHDAIANTLLSLFEVKVNIADEFKVTPPLFYLKPEGGNK
ncbi:MULTISPECIES: phosphoethanolamine transferase [Pseudoalteromonas]|uniref:phosphoethanolamine transferase n=1 Tax=Pseudoalteromonas TaxID=53246 RepID=UPI0006BAD3AD|nr:MULTISPECIES: phosphoethanolamine--lipid A transferase [Pseudoalteromonas]